MLIMIYRLLAVLTVLILVSVHTVIILYRYYKYIIYLFHTMKIRDTIIISLFLIFTYDLLPFTRYRANFTLPISSTIVQNVFR